MLGRRAAMLGGLACLAAAPPGGMVIETFGGRRCIVPVVIDGKPARMLLDTGAQRTMVTRAGLARLGLRLDPWVGTTLEGAGGRYEQHQNAVAQAVIAGGLRLVQRAPGTPFSMPVTSLDLSEADGLLGADVLMHLTIDLDIPGSRLALLPPDTAAPERGGVRLRALRRDLLLAPIRLDGHDLIALLDTGSTTSLVNARGLRKLGLSAEQVAADPAVPSSGLGGQFTAHALRFAELRLGPIAVPRPVLLLADVAEPAHDLLLGLDVLGRQRILFSYATLTLGFPPS